MIAPASFPHPSRIPHIAVPSLQGVVRARVGNPRAHLCIGAPADQEEEQPPQKETPLFAFFDPKDQKIHYAYLASGYPLALRSVGTPHSFSSYVNFNYRGRIRPGL